MGRADHQCTLLPQDLSSLSLHLDGLAEELLALEKAIAGPLDQDLMDQDAFRQVQRLDFARQSVEDCALLAHLLGRVASGQVERGSVPAKLTLESTRAILIQEGPNQPAEKLAEGEVDLF